jgi:hypothetical protein
MTNNDDWLHDNMPKVRYATDAAPPQETGTKIMTGRVVVPAQKSDSFTKSVSFGTFFTPGCSPIVTATLVCDAEDAIWLRVQGIGKKVQDHTGCNIHGYQNSASGKKKTIEQTVYVDWIAVGY